MNREGVVTQRIDENIIEVKLMRNSACGHCHECSYGDDSKDVRITVTDTLGAEKGDIIEINLGDRNVLKAAFIAYTIPLIALLLGIFGTNSFFNYLNYNNAEQISAIVGIVFMSITYIIIRKFDKKFRDSNEYLANSVKIIQKYNPDFFKLT